MPWFYILVSINKHCDTWLASECLPVEKLWLTTCSLKETSVGVALGCSHPEMIFTLLVWICRWILNKVPDKIRHYSCVVTGGEWWNSEEMVGLCLVVQCMLLSVSVCFWLGNALSFPQATCMFLNQVALSMSCLFLQSNWQKKKKSLRKSWMVLHCTGLECHLLNTQNTLLPRTLSPVSFFVLFGAQELTCWKVLYF